MRLFSRSLAASSVSTLIKTRSAVCPWLEWLVRGEDTIRTLKHAKGCHFFESRPMKSAVDPQRDQKHLPAPGYLADLSIRGREPSTFAPIISGTHHRSAALMTFGCLRTRVGGFAAAA
jgi:hypothetical protein